MTALRTSLLTMLTTSSLYAAEAPRCPVATKGGTTSLAQLGRYLDGGEACPLNAHEERAVAVFTASALSVPEALEDLRFETPRLRPDPSFADRGRCTQRRAVLACVDRYDAALRSLEKAVAYAAIKDPAVLGLARRLAGRLETIVRAKAARDVLGGAGRAPTNSENAAIEAAVAASLRRSFGTCDVDQAGCLAGACSGPDRSACVGRQDRRIQQALRQGNLRETMFFLYLANSVLTENVSRPTKKGESAAEVARGNAENVDALNAYVRGRGEDWQLSHVPVAYEGAYILKRTGLGADNNRMRDRRTLANGQAGCVASTRPLSERPVPSLEFEPLSAREIASLSERLSVDRRTLGAQTMPYHSGESCFRLKDRIEDPAYAKYNPFLQNTSDSRIPMLTGISGTTDSILTLGRTLGLKKTEDYELLRAAALGWLVSSRDHSVHEVMTAAQSFPEFKPYRFRPDGYKDILPGRPGFAREVEAYQRRQGQPMPQSVLDNCLRTREARAAD